MLNCSDITSPTDVGVSTSSQITIDPMASDNVDGNVSVVCSHTSDDTFSYGTTTVTCNATDSSTNTESCSFTVLVIGKGLSKSFENREVDLKIVANNYTFSLSER